MRSGPRNAPWRITLWQNQALCASCATAHILEFNLKTVFQRMWPGDRSNYPGEVAAPELLCRWSTWKLKGVKGVLLTIRVLYEFLFLHLVFRFYFTFGHFGFWITFRLHFGFLFWCGFIFSFDFFKILVSVLCEFSIWLLISPIV